jgi:hypothetical protein
MKCAIHFSVPGSACLVFFLLNASGQEMQPWDGKAGILLQNPAGAKISPLISAAMSASPPRAMTGSGLAAVSGGIHVKVVAPGEHDLLLPMPQLADCQAPVAYSISCTPENALSECRIQERPEGNAFLNVRLGAPTDQDVKIEWSAVVLIATKPVATNHTRSEGYLAATPCAQSGDKRIAELANKLWPTSATAGQYPKAIQAYIRDLKQTSQPRSLDALGVLASGANWICTANANLSAALMRARHVPCRSIAVVPPISRKLEMHRVVECYDHDKWISFDPSLVQADVPLKPWHEIIMVKTTVADEQTSMKPRMASALGCPFAQEVELAAGLTLSGNDFFWIIAAPLAQFEVGDEAARRTADAWKKFLKTGVLPDSSAKAAAATNLDQFLSALNR